MGRSLVSLILFMFGFAHAQSVSFESFKIAEVVISTTWKNAEDNILPALILKIETDLKAGSATDKAARVMAEEVRKAFSRDNFTKVVAQSISAMMTADEQRQTLLFLQSSAGQKYLKIGGGESQEATQLVVALIKQACVAANAQLGFFERGSLNGMCGRL